MKKMEVRTFTCNPFWENTYVCFDPESRDAALIDPGCADEGEWTPIATFIAAEGLKVRHILLTHGHVDHTLGTAFATRAYGLGVSGSLDEMLRLPDAETQARLFGVPLTARPAAVVHDLRDGDTLIVGDHTIAVIDIPGHSPHGLVYYLPKDGILFTGDVLFEGSVGRSDFGPAFGCDGRALVEGIRTRLFVLPHATLVWPGHGGPTTIGAERANNPFVV